MTRLVFPPFTGAPPAQGRPVNIWKHALEWAESHGIDVLNGTDDEVLVRINAARIALREKPFAIKLDRELAR